MAKFTDNEGFQRWLTDTVFGLTYAQAQGRGSGDGPGLTARLPRLLSALMLEFIKDYSLA